jgi:hypothetical protein
MAILESKATKSTDGIKKSIDSNSKEVAMDILQRGIYAFPIPSTVRELASNCYDAVSERNMAKDILKGKSKVEDHFEVKKVDGIYHASGWDPDYFDLKYMSDDDNVYIYYDEGTQKDTLRFRDNGVGLGKDRIVGYFQLGYSSKRSQRGSLGKWGLGSKVALSLGIDSFTVINRYNGKKFKFEVYIDTVISSTPKFGTQGKNDCITVNVPQEQEDGSMKSKQFTFYYEKTDEPNGLEVQIPVKKYSKKDFVNAIESQLMYIPNIKFGIKSVSAIDYDYKDISAKIVYKDDNIIISENNIFTKPHILLGSGSGYINYGYVAFKELEIEPKSGAVGLLMNINDVEVTPSRESVIWSTLTRKAVLDSYNKVTATATTLINSILDKEDDYFYWIKNAATIKNSLVNSNSSDNQSTLQKLAGIIDASSVNKILFTKHGMNKIYISETKSMLGEKILLRSYVYDNYAKKVIRTKITNCSSIVSKDNIYITSGPADKLKDRYIFEYLSNKKSFLVIKLLDGWEIEKTSNLIGNSKKIESYDDIKVPEDIIDKYLLEIPDGAESSDDEDDQLSTIRNADYLAALRKKNKEILVHKPKNNSGYYSSIPDINKINFSSEDIKILDLLATTDEFVYGTFGDRDFIMSLFRVLPYYNTGIVSSISNTFFSRPIENSLDSGYYTDYINNYLNNNLKKINFRLISKEVENLVQSKHNFQHIYKFAIKRYTNDGKLVFSDYLKKCVTWCLAVDKITSKISNQMLDRKYFYKEITSNLFGPNMQEILVAYNYYLLKISPRTIPSFFQNLISLQYIQEDVQNDTDTTDLLNTINLNLPEALCNNVDEIKSVDIIDVNWLNQLEYNLNYYQYFVSFINMFTKGVDRYSSASSLQILELLSIFKKLFDAYKKENNIPDLKDIDYVL